MLTDIEGRKKKCIMKIFRWLMQTYAAPHSQIDPTLLFKCVILIYASVTYNAHEDSWVDIVIYEEKYFQQMPLESWGLNQSIDRKINCN